MNVIIWKGLSSDLRHRTDIKLSIHCMRRENVRDGIEQMRKSSLLHTDRECSIILEIILYEKDKHDERSGYYETPCRLCQRL